MKFSTVGPMKKCYQPPPGKIHSSPLEKSFRRPHMKESSSDREAVHHDHETLNDYFTV